MMEQGNRTLRLELRSKNAVLWHFIYDNYGSIAALCREQGYLQTTICSLLNLKLSPYKKRDKSPSKVAQSLCDLSGLSAYELFDPDLYNVDLIPPQLQVAEVDPRQFVSLEAAKDVPLLTTSIEDVLDAGEDPVGEALVQTMSTLTPREEKVLRMRFGLDDREYDLKEVGDYFNLTRERIRQIEGKALRKLRHPLFCKTLKLAMAGKTVDRVQEKRLKEKARLAREASDRRIMKIAKMDRWRKHEKEREHWFGPSE